MTLHTTLIVLTGLMVAGRPLEVAGGAAGRMTRARSKHQGGLRFSQMPAPAKVLQVLGQLLSSDAESRGNDAGWARALAAEWAGGEESSDEDDGDGAGGEGADSPAAQGMTAATLHAAGCVACVCDGALCCMLRTRLGGLETC
jgi:hypothetical protein